MFIRTRSATRHPLRRLGIAATVGATATVVVVAAAAGAGAAGPPSYEPPLPPTDQFQPSGDDDDAPPPTISIPPNISTPVIPLPGDDDGPDYTGPVIPLPGGDGPVFTGPLIPLPGGDEPDDTGPTLPPTDDTTAPTDPAPGPGATDPADPAPETSAPLGTAAPSGDVSPFLQITSASVDCAGVLHVTYETGAVPEPSPEGEHVVMFSRSSDPTAVVAHRIAPRPINSVFTVDMQSAAPGGYRVYVVADFEPANLDGVLLADEADAAAPVDCPAAPTTTGLPPGPTSVAPTSG
ncbi:hypothetical protein [Desertimonas flava]|uniref:hypothetical protein n=1 Tax=Desertimonas flava TaxID=2064846 RepID=UPI000E35489B|nr:hypothetical protein [Desertimonas flava]